MDSRFRRVRIARLALAFDATVADRNSDWAPKRTLFGNALPVLLSYSDDELGDLKAQHRRATCCRRSVHDGSLCTFGSVLALRCCQQLAANGTKGIVLRLARREEPVPPPITVPFEPQILDEADNGFNELHHSVQSVPSQTSASPKCAASGEMSI